MDKALVVDKILRSGSNESYFLSLIQNENEKINKLMRENMEEGLKYFSHAHKLKYKPCILSTMSINYLCW